jgi:hypothetical protein
MQPIFDKRSNTFLTKLVIWTMYRLIGSFTEHTGNITEEIMNQIRSRTPIKIIGKSLVKRKREDGRKMKLL